MNVKNIILSGLALVFLSVFSACSEEESGSSPSEILVVDTLFVEKTDTIVVNRIDSIYIDRVDSVFVDRVDTLYIPDSSENGRVRCRADFDSSYVPGKSVFLGNSLLLGYIGFGMSATAPENDYFFRMERFFEANEIPFSATRITGVYENMVLQEDQIAFLEERLYPNLDDSVGLVVLQLGDNMDNELEYSVMESSLGMLMENVCTRAPNARVLWVGEWYSTALKQFLLKRLTSDFGITFVDISDLNVPENQSFVGEIVNYPDEHEFEMDYDSYETDGEFLTVNYIVEDSLYTSHIKVSSFKVDENEKRLTWVGKEYIVSHPFVASHPNDKAFAEIAKRILGALGYDLME